ncbi:MAG TPA: GNAT family N-acetyltransferase [Candidatus Dormibacteraeota bacterium]|jgi:uncharacterized protein YbdZ (MbtH family)/GNAT superfamily N-acetyltransferase|nr:GNAT family N-acetyltransferase [Candidatus Dormibacteraeota bacterium]
MTMLVVVNHEEQYSIWPSGRDVPDGWRAVGFEGSEEECLAHIEVIWTDMRPRSLRERLATTSGDAAPGDPPATTIDSERIVLREIPPVEAAGLLRGEHPDGVVWTPGYPLEGTLIAARAQVDQAHGGALQPGFGMYQVIRRADGAVIGDIGFHGPPDESGHVSVGFGIVPEARGQGYATEALVAISRWAVSQPAVECVLADTTHDNPASQGVLRGAGFRHIRDGDDLTYYEWRTP